MKAWRLNAQAINLKRARIMGINSFLPRSQHLPVPSTARVQKVRQQLIDRVLDRGVRSNWLLSGLMIHAGIIKPA